MILNNNHIEDIHSLITFHRVNKARSNYKWSKLFICEVSIVHLMFYALFEDVCLILKCIVHSTSYVGMNHLRLLVLIDSITTLSYFLVSSRLFCYDFIEFGATHHTLP